MQTIQKITPFLWFDGQAEEAMNFYCSIFENSKKGEVRRMGGNEVAPGGPVITTSFELCGQEFIALNGGPHFTFSPAVSFFVHCESQADVDHLWEKLGEGGQIQRCGWLTDKFGITWQIVPTVLGRYMTDPDPVRAGRVMQAMMKMVKLDIAGLQRAYSGE